MSVPAFKCPSCKCQALPKQDILLFADLYCPICMMSHDFKECILFRCGHFACTVCFDKWYEHSMSQDQTAEALPPPMPQEDTATEVPLPPAAQLPQQPAAQLLQQPAAQLPQQPLSTLGQWAQTPHPAFNFAGSHVIWVLDYHCHFDTWSLVNLDTNQPWRGYDPPPPPPGAGPVEWIRNSRRWNARRA